MYPVPIYYFYCLWYMYRFVFFIIFLSLISEWVLYNYILLLEHVQECFNFPKSKTSFHFRIQNKNESLYSTAIPNHVFKKYKYCRPWQKILKSTAVGDLSLLFKTGNERSSTNGLSLPVPCCVNVSTLSRYLTDSCQDVHRFKLEKEIKCRSVTCKELASRKSEFFLSFQHI